MKQTTIDIRENRIDNITKRLSLVYAKDSETMKIVKRGLQKFSIAQLDSLLMILIVTLPKNNMNNLSSK